MSDFSTAASVRCPRCKQRFSWDDARTCPNGCFDVEDEEIEELESENRELRKMLGFETQIEDQLTEELLEAKREGRDR